MRLVIPRLVPMLFIAATSVTACDTNSPTATGTAAPTAIGLTGGNVQRAAIGSALPVPLLVRVTDQYGAGFPGAQVTFTAGGGATLAATTVTTDANGNASTTATLGMTVGIDTITANVTGSTVPATFLEYAQAGPPATDSLATGNNQVGTTGVVLAVPLSVIVYDSRGNPVVGDSVTWTSATGTLSAPTSITDATGTATITFTPALGANTVIATIGGSTLVVTFTETGN